MTRDEINKLVLPFLLKIFDKERVKTSSLCKVCVGAKGEYGGHTYTDDRFGSHRDWYNCSNCNGTGYELREGTIQDVIEDVDLYEQLLAALAGSERPEDLGCDCEYLGKCKGDPQKSDYCPLITLARLSPS